MFTSFSRRYRESEVQVAAVSSEPDINISTLLQAGPMASTSASFSKEQEKDAQVREVIQFLKTKVLPTDPKRAKRIASQQSLFVILDNVLYYVDPKRDHRLCIVVPKHLRDQILGETHRGLMSGHFSGKRTFSALPCHWWWDNMYVDTMKYVDSCPECTITAGTGRHYKPPLHPIPVSRSFQIVGADLMELPRTRRGNKYVIVLQDYLTK